MRATTRATLRATNREPDEKRIREGIFLGTLLSRSNQPLAGTCLMRTEYDGEC